jgi:hypothetical protein
MSVKLYLRIRLEDGTRNYCNPTISANGKLKPFYAMVGGTSQHHPEGVYSLRYRRAGKLVWDSVGTDPQSAVVKHQLPQMLAQRIYGLALGYEDLNDHEHLRSDPLLGLLRGKRELDEPLAGKSTLNRLELTGRRGRYHKIGYSAEALDRLLADLCIESHAAPPTQIVLDLDATDVPLYGHQPERFFHGYYGSYCYLPLYIFAGDQLLCARLRPANQDAAAGSVAEVSCIVAQLRARWPEVRIILRADSGFCRREFHSNTIAKRSRGRLPGGPEAATCHVEH